jgi:mannitol-1-phosphate/altronate dehydrogenase
MVPVAYLHGLRTVREAGDDAHIGNFIREAIFEEIVALICRTILCYSQHPHRLNIQSLLLLTHRLPNSD